MANSYTNRDSLSNNELTIALERLVNAADKAFDRFNVALDENKELRSRIANNEFLLDENKELLNELTILTAQLKEEIALKDKEINELSFSNAEKEELQFNQSSIDEELHKLREEYDDLRLKFDETSIRNEEIPKLTSLLEEKNSFISTLHDTIEDLKSKLSHYEYELENYSYTKQDLIQKVREINILNTKLIESKSQVSELESKLIQHNNLIDRTNDYSESLSQLTQECEKYTKEIELIKNNQLISESSYQSRINELEENKLSLQLIIENLNAELTLKSDDNNSVEHELVKTRRTVIELEEELLSIKRDNSTNEAEWSNELSKRETQISAANKEIESLKQAMEVQEKTIARLFDSEEESSRMNTQLKNELNRKDTEYNEMLASIDSHLSIISKLNKEIELKDLDIITLKDSIKGYISKISQFEDDITSKSAKIQSIEIQLDKFKNMIDSDQLKINALEMAINQKNNEIKVVKNQLDDLEFMLLEKDEEISNHLSQIEEKDHELSKNSNILEMISNLEQDQVLLNSKIKQQNEEIELKNLTIDNLKSLLSDIEKNSLIYDRKILELADKVSELSLTIKEKDETIRLINSLNSELNAKYRISENEKIDNIKKLREANSQITMFSDNLNTHHKQYNDLEQSYKEMNQIIIEQNDKIHEYLQKIESRDELIKSLRSKISQLDRANIVFNEKKAKLINKIEGYLLDHQQSK